VNLREVKEAQELRVNFLRVTYKLSPKLQKLKSLKGEAEEKNNKK
jgi:hypothetical protein